MATAETPAKAKENKAPQVPARRRGIQRRGWERDLGSLVEDLFDDLRLPARWQGLFDEREFQPMPSIDVLEKDEKLVVRAELPGMSKDDIDVSLTESTLTIRGEKKDEEEVKEDDYYRSERTFGSIRRTIDLPDQVRAAEATASFRDGVLEVVVPKTEEATARSVKLEVE